VSSFDNKKELRFVVTLGTGTFGSSSANQITLEGFRASVTIDKGGGQMFGTLRAQVYGVSQSDMNSVTTLQYKALTVTPNTISVYAIDGQQETLVFAGNIVNAWPDYKSTPDVFLQIEAQAAFINKLTPVAPSSFQGAADVAVIMGKLADKMGYTFENNGVQVPLSNVYLPGTGTDQAQKLADMAGIWWGIDNDILWITPRNSSRGGTIPQISSSSGLNGYPTPDGQGFINFQTLFNPAIRFLGRIDLVSSIPKANAQWIVVSVAHRLESEKPGGAWFSQIRGNTNGLVPVR
jgi:hypothetical protein